MKNHQKGSAVPVLLAIIALLIISGGIYIHHQLSTNSSPTTNPSSNSSSGLTTYDNFGISFQYPSGWGIPSENFYENGLGSISFDYGSSTAQPLAVFIEQDSNPLGTGPANETFDQMIARYRTNDKYIYQQKAISADGIQGVELFYQNAVTGQPYHIEAYFPSQNGSYITFGADEEAVSENTLETIISTIKWDNGTAVKLDPATGMAIYSNNGIRFEYPEKFNTQYASLTMKTSVEKIDATKIDSNGCYPLIDDSGKPSPESIITINGVTFCTTASVDVGAGQANKTYSYMTTRNGNAYTVAYSVGTSNGCGAYQNSPDLSSPENQNYNACLAAQQNFASLVTAPIQQSIATFKFTI